MQNNKGGFIQLIVIIILIVIILSLLGVSLDSLFSNRTLKENFNFLWDAVVNVWDTYLGEPIRFLISWLKSWVLPKTS